MGHLAFWTVDGVLSAGECRALIARVESAGVEPAPISTASGPEWCPELRNNRRLLFDDPVLAGRLYDAVAATVPRALRGRGPVGANERLRAYRYEPGQFFAPHLDGSFRRDEREASELTLLVYLNEDFEGGETHFLAESVSVRPRTGQALIFWHRQLHEGCVVRRGIKYALRTDVMFRALGGLEARDLG